MKIVVGQMEPLICKVSENLDRVKTILDDAQQQDADVLVLPELCNSGYVFNNADEVRNFCGHPATTDVLNASGLNIPSQLIVTDSEGNPVLNRFGSPQGQFWNGVGVAVAARPRGGVRAAAQTGDTEVSLDGLEFLQFEFIRS